MPQIYIIKEIENIKILKSQFTNTRKFSELPKKVKRIRDVPRAQEAVHRAGGEQEHIIPPLWSS